MSEHCQQVYDHRLRRLVFESGDITIALNLGVPRSTARRWLREAPLSVVSMDIHDADMAQLRLEVLRLRRQLGVIRALYRLLLVLVRILGRLDGRHLNEGCRTMILRAITRARPTLPLRSALRVLGLSGSRYHSWVRETQGCESSESSCPRRSPNRLTLDEVMTIQQMVTSPEYRHVPTGSLALLAQRLGKVVAAPSTWYRLIRRYRWRRPRKRVYPAKPKVGLRATRPDEAWHIDTSIIKLLDGTKVYLHGVIDNFSRKILAWRVAVRLEAASTTAVLGDAIRASLGQEIPTAVVDGGSENFNSSVDELVTGGMLKRLLAQTDVSFSNSPIEAFWKSMKNQWLYLNTLDTVASVRKLIAFYVEEHNSKMPHSAFQGQTPDEMYYGTGHDVPANLASARADARRSRLQANRVLTCESCPVSKAGPETSTAAA